MFTEACSASTGIGDLVRRNLHFPSQLCEGHVLKENTRQSAKRKKNKQAPSTWQWPWFLIFHFALLLQENVTYQTRRESSSTLLVVTLTQRDNKLKSMWEEAVVDYSEVPSGKFTWMDWRKQQLIFIKNRGWLCGQGSQPG